MCPNGVQKGLRETLRKCATKNKGQHPSYLYGPTPEVETKQSISQKMPVWTHNSQMLPLPGDLETIGSPSPTEMANWEERNTQKDRVHFNPLTE